MKEYRWLILAAALSAVLVGCLGQGERLGPEIPPAVAGRARPVRAGAIEIIGHRGAPELAPENTLAGVKLGWELGADAVEVDVHLSADRRVMVIHDSSTQRTAGVNLKVPETDSQQLRKLDVGSFMAERFRGERIPLLEEVLALIPQGQRLFIEIKCGRKILPALEKAIAQSDRASQLVILGYSLRTMKASKKRMPDIPTYWVLLPEKNRRTGAWIPYRDDLLRKAKSNGLDGVVAHWAGVTEQFVTAARGAGLALYVWTVDDAAEARRLRDLGVDGIITNRPGRLKKQL